MNKTEFEALKDVEREKERIISINDLRNQEDRTLLYGYTTDGDTWHVYVKWGEIYTVATEVRNKMHKINVENNEEYVPNKRLYPECCDYEFCSLLKQKGVYLSFTTWNEKREEKKYYGEVI